MAPLHRPSGQLHQRTRQEGVSGDVAVVLLAGRHHQRGAVGPSVGEVADGVAEAGRGVQVEEGWATRRLGIAVGHAHDGRLLEAEDVVEVVGLRECIDERELGAARVAEDVCDALRPEHVQQHLASDHHHPDPTGAP